MERTLKSVKEEIGQLLLRGKITNNLTEEIFNRLPEQDENEVNDYSFYASLESSHHIYNKPTESAKVNETDSLAKAYEDLEHINIYAKRHNSKATLTLRDKTNKKNIIDYKLLEI